MNLSKFAAELYIRIKEWIGPEFSKLKEDFDSRIAKSEETFNLGIKSVEDKIPAPIDREALVKELAEALPTEAEETLKVLIDQILSPSVDEIMESNKNSAADLKSELDETIEKLRTDLDALDEKLLPVVENVLDAIQKRGEEIEKAAADASEFRETIESETNDIRSENNKAVENVREYIEKLNKEMSSYVDDILNKFEERVEEIQKVVGESKEFQEAMESKTAGIKSENSDAISKLRKELENLNKSIAPFIEDLLGKLEKRIGEIEDNFNKKLETLVTVDHLVQDGNNLLEGVEERISAFDKTISDLKDGFKASEEITAEYVKKALDAAEERAKNIEARIEDIPVFDSEKLNQYLGDPEAEKKLLDLIARHSKKPKDGIDGRDGLDIEVLPDINPEKTYKRGTYALKNGGIWKARADTQGMAGWECVLRGYPSYEVEQVDEKVVEFRIKDSLGNEHAQQFVFPMMIYRGVWREGTYTPGDCVTLDGSVWHCDKETESRPGRNAEDWTLCVKGSR